MPDAEIGKFWKRHQQWEKLADRLKNNVTRARFCALTLCVLGAVLQTIAVVIAPTKSEAATAAEAWATLCAIGGTVMLAGAAIVAKQFLAPSAVRGWLRARSASEGLKSAVYRYLAGGLPYVGDDRAQAFKRDCEAIDGYFREVATDLADTLVEKEKPLPTITDPKTYINERVQPQRKDYYLPRAKRNATRARQFRNIELAISILAAGLGAVVSGLHISAADPKGLGAWIAVVTTIGAAIAAHATSNRYVEQAQVFYATARELEDATTEWNTSAEQASTLAQFVGRCEDAISTENKGWMVKLNPDEK